MHEATLHLTAMELQTGLFDVLESPQDAGRLEAIFVRPAANERRALTEAHLTIEGGISGDRWVTDSYYKLEDGRSDPRCQVSLMNARFLRQVAGDDEAMCLAGDNLIVDLDLSEENLPAGTQLLFGADVILEMSGLPHTGCSKFSKRYGDDVRAFVNSQQGKSLHLRGRYASVVRGGKVHVDDSVHKRPPTS
jgi:MOSC domain